jgi:oxygen-independent coproporphyrinogen-3 oxidase
VNGVYIAWPFCAQKCTYCNFASGVFPRELERAYLDALCAEIFASRGRPSALPSRGREGAVPSSPDTVYLGGGTPGSMEPAALRRILALIDGRPWREATLEAAPGSIDAERARAWVECGINRVSLGVQSFVDAELRQTGRKHTAEIVARDVALLRDAGIHEINLDLIAGLPHQTAASWRASLDWIERLAPEHVSVYMFEIDEDSRLGHELLHGGARYGAATMPDEDQTVAFYEEAVERLAGLGLARYEISNFARAGHESQHNLKYWRLDPYVGYGADAHSYDGAWRWQNVEPVREYVERIGRGESPRLATERASATERYWVGLRLMEGIALTDEERAGWAEAIARLGGLGLVEEYDGRLRLTGRGVLLSNEVFEEFLEAK